MGVVISRGLVMADSQNPRQFKASSAECRDRKFSVSVNRGKASQKIRYVEAGGAAVNTGACTLCQSMPDLSGDSQEGEDRSN